MLAKLALRNVRRSAKDYLVYFFTMTVVVALIFSKEIRDSFQGVEIMEVMLGLATFFIVLIIAWLINYMMRFILKREAGNLASICCLAWRSARSQNCICARVCCSVRGHFWRALSLVCWCLSYIYFIWVCLHGLSSMCAVGETRFTRRKRCFCSGSLHHDGKTPENLRKLLDDAVNIDAGTMLGGTECVGSESILVRGSDNLVRDNLLLEMKCMLSSVIFPLTYIGLVFLCVALTVLSVQQLSDSAKYKFRYQVLRQIGMGTREIAGLILRKLFVVYLCPAIFAAVISFTVFANPMACHCQDVIEDVPEKIIWHLPKVKNIVQRKSGRHSADSLVTLQGTSDIWKSS